MNSRAEMHLFHVYALASERSIVAVESFRARWALGFEESADEYEVPRFAENPQVVFDSVDALIKYLMRAPTQNQSVYWNNPHQESRVRNAVLFFTTDGGLIAGINVWATFDSVALDMVALCASIGGEFAYVAAEEPPDDNTETFKRLAKSSSGPKIADGETVLCWAS